jgi:hypothetical protein
MRTKIRASMLSHFSKAMWERWLRDLNGPDEADPQFIYLRDGIAQFRRSMAEKEARSRLRKAL